MMKEINKFIEELKSNNELSNKSFDVISIDYDKENGIILSKDLSTIEKNIPYKFYIFNELVMFSGVRMDDTNYFIEEIRVVNNYKEGVLFLDKKEITKVSGHNFEKVIKFRKALIDGVEKIQFIGLEV